MIFALEYLGSYWGRPARLWRTDVSCQEADKHGTFLFMVPFYSHDSA